MKMTRWAAPAALAVALVGAPLTVLPSAAHAVGGTDTLSVTVDDYSSHTSLPGVSVQLYSTATGATVGDALTTDTNGSVSFTGLADGGYAAKVAGTATHHEKYSVVENLTAANAGPSVTVYPVRVGSSRGSLAGTVTQATTQDLEAYVALYPATATQSQVDAGQVTPVASTTVGNSSDALGTLSTDWAETVPVGQYKILVSDWHTQTWHYCCYYTFATEAWYGAPSTSDDADHASLVTVTSAAVKNVGTIALPAATPPTTPEISGTVTGSGGIKLGDGAYQNDVEVLLYEQNTSDLSWSQVDSTWTDNDGTYSFSGHAAGIYTVEIYDPSGEYAKQWLGGAADSGSGTPPSDVQTFAIDGTDPATKDVSVKQSALDTSSGLHGTLTDDTGKTHPGAVNVYDVYGFEIWSGQTRRDGTWTLPTTILPPGQYKVQVEDDVDVDGWYGGKTFKSAATFTVPVKGTVNAGTSKLPRYVTISGKINLPAVSGTNQGETYVQIFDTTGDEVDDTWTDDGTYSFSEKPGTYYIGASGERSASWDDSNVYLSGTPFIEQFWKGTYTLGSATPIKLASGGKATVSYTLGRTLLATAAPAIGGSATMGGTLTASTGTWNVGQDLAFTYTWTRGGTVVGHAASYKPVAADQGKTITVTVQARDTNGDYLSGKSTKSVAVAKATKAKKAKHKKKHKK